MSTDISLIDNIVSSTDAIDHLSTDTTPVPGATMKKSTYKVTTGGQKGTRKVSITSTTDSDEFDLRQTATIQSGMTLRSAKKRKIEDISNYGDG